MFDWDDLRFFLAVARLGNLTAAAKELRVAQSTAGRRLASLEVSLGARLFNRTPDGYSLTLAGQGVRDQAERAEAEILSVERLAGGLDSKLEGTVRVTAAETFATYMLAPCFAELQSKHPSVAIELMPSSQQLSLSMREADIAIRLKSPDQHDLVIRKIGRIAFGLYASASYLAKHGQPDFEAGCAGHRLMTLVDDSEGDPQAYWLSEQAGRATLGLRTCSHDALLSATRAGGGLSCLAMYRADRKPELVRLATPVPAPSADIWLIVHRDNRVTPRVRATLSAIVESVKSHSGTLDPATPADDH